MAFPTAVSPTVRSPGFYLLVNLLAGTTSLGAAPLRGCILAVIGAGGDLTADTEIRQAIAGPDAAGAAFLPGMPGHLAAKRVFEEHPLALIDLVGVAPPAGVAASGTFTFTLGTPPVTTAVVFDFDIAGRVKEISWNPGESLTTVAAKVAAAYTAITADLPCLVTSSLGVVTVAAKEEGTFGNDITISVTRRSGGAPADAVCAASGATLSGGTLTADISTALGTIAGQEYDFILCVVGGNTDTNTAGSTSCPSRVATHIETYQTGASAKLQQAIFGVTGTLANAKTGTAYQNDVNLQHVLGRGYRSLPAEVGGAELGRRLRMEATDPSVNPNGEAYRATLYPPANLVSGELSGVEREDAYQSGVTPLIHNTSGVPLCDRPITTHWKDDAGNADDRCLDVSIPSTTYRFARRLRTSIPQEFRGAKISANLGPGDDPLPPGTVEVREVQEFVIGEAKAFVALGWFDQTFINAAIANGEFLARVNPLDDNQVDIVTPTRVSRAYLKTSAVVNAV